jgi:hypothetical protein
VIRTGWARPLLGAFAVAALCAGSAAASTLPVDRRPPGPYDDFAHDYSPGDLWNLPAGQGRRRGLWRLDDPTPGHAVWHRLTGGILPADSVPGVTFAHCYGTTRLRAGWRAPPYRAGTGSVSDPAGLPVAALADQCGAVDAVQGDASSRPRLFPPDRPGDPPALLFASGGLARASLDRSGPVRRFLAFGSAMRVRTRDFGLTAMVGNAGLGSANPLAFFDDTASGGLGVMLADGADPAHSASVLFGTSHPSGLFVPITRTVFAVSSDAGGVAFQVGDRHAPTRPPLVADLGTSGGGRLAAIAPDGAGGYGAEIDAVLIGPALSRAQQARLDAAIVETFGLLPQLRDRVVMDGDSRAAGALSDRLGSPLRRAAPSLARPALLYDLATGGDTMAHRLALFPVQAARLHDLLAPVEFYIQQAGLNDILLAGRSPEAVERDAARWAAAAHALGGNVLTVRETTLPSVMPSTGRSRDLRRLACLERDGSAGFDLIHDLARDDPRFASAAVYADPALFADQVHPTDLGYALWGRGLAAVLDRSRPAMPGRSARSPDRCAADRDPLR